MPSINLLPEDFTIDSYKKKEKIAVLSLAIFFLVVSGFVYAGSEFGKRANQKNLDTVNEQLTEVDKKIDEEIKSNEIFSSEFKKEDIEGALNNHVYFSKVLVFLKTIFTEDVALAEVDFKYDVATGYSAEIIANAKSYSAAIDQIAILKDSYWTKDAVFSEITAEQEGFVEMTGTVYLRDDLLSYHEEYWEYGIGIMKGELNRYIKLDSFSASLRDEKGEDGEKEKVVLVKFGGVCYEESELKRMETNFSKNSLVKEIKIDRKVTDTPGVVKFSGSMTLRGF
ncbi:MAG: hypothetical protein PHI66_01895 [Candidatus Pacebacteria bacterium]|nr:hypothetical protein [Candidatus Paceibacterota bacterium]